MLDYFFKGEKKVLLYCVREKGLRERNDYSTILEREREKLKIKRKDVESLKPYKKIDPKRVG